ncbi:MAG: calcium-binding protein, partial [Bauldia sp.]
ILDGGGGSDTLIGGKGDDTYIVDGLEDVISETLSNASSGGVDTVKAGITFSIAALANIDNLTLTGSAISGTGNSLNNVMRGNALTNFLDGGLGADTLKGGAGVDVYFLDNAGDVVDEEGNTDLGDEVRTSFALASGIAGVEKYTYLGSAAWIFTGTGADETITGGTGNDTLDGGEGHDLMFGGADEDMLYGGAGNDRMYGEEGNDRLNGDAGNDSLYGGVGNDVFLINASPGHEMIYGGAGSSWTDTIDLSGFAGQGGGWTLTLDGGHAITSQSAHDILLDQDASGHIDFADGSSVTFQGIEKIHF